MRLRAEGDAMEEVIQSMVGTIDFAGPHGAKLKAHKDDKLRRKREEEAEAAAAEDEALKPESWRVLKRMHRECEALDRLAMVGGGTGRVFCAAFDPAHLRLTQQVLAEPENHRCGLSFAPLVCKQCLMHGALGLNVRGRSLGWRTNHDSVARTS